MPGAALETAGARVAGSRGRAVQRRRRSGVFACHWLALASAGLFRLPTRRCLLPAASGRAGVSMPDQRQAPIAPPERGWSPARRQRSAKVSRKRERVCVCRDPLPLGAESVAKRRASQAGGGGRRQMPEHSQEPVPFQQPT